MANEIWKLFPGQLAAYTEDKDIMRRIKRYYGYPIMAEYEKDGKVIGRQYRVPMEKRRSIERMLGVKTGF